MKLSVIGCAPAYTRHGRPSSCYLVEGEDGSLVLDMGQGSFSALSQRRAPESLDGILISHLHADHFVDLIPLRHYLVYEARATVALRGPHGLRERLDAFQAATDFLSALPGEPLRPGSFQFAGFEIEAHHVSHIPDSYAFRVSGSGEGSGLVYSGDCGRPDDLLPLIRPGDTLLCEAAFGTGSKDGGIHLTASQAASVAARGRAGRLILTHVLDKYPDESLLVAARSAFDGEVLRATDQLVIDLAR